MSFISFQDLVGLDILKARVESEYLIVFETLDCNYEITADADCCSESWFEHIEGIENLDEAKILTINEIAQGEITPGARQEYDKLYFIKLITSKGYVDIDMRNSSNGYYGGSILVHKTNKG